MQAPIDINTTVPTPVMPPSPVEVAIPAVVPAPAVVAPPAPTAASAVVAPPSPTGSPAVAAPTTGTTAIVVAEQPKRAEYVRYDQYGNANLACTPAEKKTVPGTGPGATPPTPEQNYYTIPLMFNYGVPENKILDDFFLEGCPMVSNGGIQTKVGQKGGEEHSIMVRFDSASADQERFIKTMNEIHYGASYVLSTMKGTVKLHNFNCSTPQMCEATGFKNPIYRARDEVTGEPIQGRSPSMFLKLFKRGKGALEEKTLFTGLDKKPIPWQVLTGVDLKFIPLIHIKRIYIGGGKASLQMEVVSAVVLSVKARNSTTRQTSTIDKYTNESPELVDTVAAQVATLMASRQDQMIGAIVPTIAGNSTTAGTGAASESTPTFTGIVPTGTGTNVSMTDFTAGAPTRAQLN